MSKRTKKYIKAAENKISDVLSLKDAIANVKKTSYSKFDGTVELHITTIITKERDPKSIKGSVSLPHMEGKASIIAVAVPEHLEKEAEKAGADIFKSADLLKDIATGKLEFDVLLATPDMMAKLAVHGKELGPKGLMPNPKSGTVITPDKLSDVITEFKQGKLVFKADKTGGIHVPVGKISLDSEKIRQNVDVMLNTVAATLGKSKEATIKKVCLAPTMGPSVTFDFKLTE